MGHNELQLLPMNAPAYSRMIDRLFTLSRNPWRFYSHLRNRQMELNAKMSTLRTLSDS